MRSDFNDGVSGKELGDGFCRRSLFFGETQGVFGHESPEKEGKGKGVGKGCEEIVDTARCGRVLVHGGRCEGRCRLECVRMGLLETVQAQADRTPSVADASFLGGFDERAQRQDPDDKEKENDTRADGTHHATVLTEKKGSVKVSERFPHPQPHS